MFPKANQRKRSAWRVILADAVGRRRTAVVDAPSKRRAISAAEALWPEAAAVYDVSVVSDFDPGWFDYRWC